MDYAGSNTFAGAQHSTIWEYASGLTETFNSTWALMTESADSHANYKAYNVNEEGSFDGNVYGGAQEANTLSEMLIVEEEQGATLTINGKLTKERQQMVLDVTQRIRKGRPDNTLSGQSGLLLRVYVAENGDMDGILMESPLGFQVAFLDTTRAFSSRSGANSRTRRVEIIQPGDDQVGAETPDQIHYSKDDSGKTFAICLKSGHHSLEVRSVSGPGGKAPEAFNVSNNIDSTESGVTYCKSPNLKDQDQEIAEWGTDVQGVIVRGDSGGEWLKVGRKYLPVFKNNARVLEPRGELLMKVHLDTSGNMANISDGRGELVGSMQTRRNDTGDEMMILQVGNGIDAGLVLSALFAALKLD